MSTFKTLCAGGLCILLAASCNNGSNTTDCSAELQAKDQRIAALEDSLRMAMANTGNKTTATQTTDSTNGANASSSTATTTESGKEESMYKKGSTATSHKGGHVPGEFPEGSTRILTDKDVKFLSRWGLEVMLNEIYARHGMKFSGALGRHFENESWYHGTSSNVNGQLTKIEKHNIEFIKNYKFSPELTS